MARGLRRFIARDLGLLREPITKLRFDDVRSVTREEALRALSIVQSTMIPGRVGPDGKVEKIVKLTGGRVVSNSPIFKCTLAIGIDAQARFALMLAAVMRYWQGARSGATTYCIGQSASIQRFRNGAR